MFEKTTKVRVYDAMCGQGKTERIIEDISKMTNPVLYISPLLSEVDRVCGFKLKEGGNLMKDDDGNIMYEEDHPLRDKSFIAPTRKWLRNKSDVIKELIVGGENIAATHTLFSMMDSECISILKSSNYTLIIDEDLCVWKRFQLRGFRNDEHGDGVEYIGEKSKNTTDAVIHNFINNNIINVGDLGVLSWNEDKFSAFEKDPVWYEIKNYCDSQQLLLIDNKVVFWELPPSLLRAFKDIIVATYMFKSSYFATYLTYNNIPFEIETFGKKPKDIAHLVNMVEGKINSVGDSEGALSYTHLCADKRSDRLEAKSKLNKNLLNFFKNICKSKPEDRLWTTYKSAVEGIQGRYGTSWLAFNTKATNDYIHCRDVAYLCNNYPNVMLLKIVAKRQEHAFDKDLWALSTMLQFIFRSRLRKGEPINLYIPSSRMRELFKRWLGGEFDEI